MNFDLFGGTGSSGAPGASCRLEFFASSNVDDSGHGEGEQFLGATSIVTDGNGKALIDVMVDSAPAGWSVTATATLEPTGETSEFAQSIGVQAELGSRYCSPAVPNSSGAAGVVHGIGSTVVADQDLQLLATDLPANQFGDFLVSATQGFTPNPGGSQGHLCLGGTIGRFHQQVQSSGPASAILIEVDLAQLPAPIGVAVQPGDTWNFTTWYRDLNPTSTSNFTDAVSVSFQ